MDHTIIQNTDGRSSCHKNIKQWTIDGMPKLIRDAGASMGPGPNVMVLACRWRYFAAEDLEGLKKLASNLDYRIVRIPCSGQVQADWIATALDSGAGTVLIMGGHPATCSYTSDARCGDQMHSTVLGSSGIDPARLLMDWSVGGGSERFLKSVGQMVVTVEKSGSTFQ
jgi:F420-non-reducing hydrogenase iron-sulfur subunit